MLLNCSWLCKGSCLYFILTKSKESKWLISETMFKLYMFWVLFWLTNENNCSSFRRVSLKTTNKSNKIKWVRFTYYEHFNLKFRKTHIIVCNQEKKHAQAGFFLFTYDYFKPPFFFNILFWKSYAFSIKSIIRFQTSLLLFSLQRGNLFCCCRHRINYTKS